MYLDPLVPVPVVMWRRRDKMVLKLLAMAAVAVTISGRSTRSFVVGVGLHPRSVAEPSVRCILRKSSWSCDWRS